MLKIYNTLSRQKEVFHPIQTGKIQLYVCGVTVYDYCHLGHGRTYTALDAIIRYLRWRHYEVTYVRNITDIDDKIIKRAQEQNQEYHAITQRFIAAMYEDFDALQINRPDQEPRATEYIPQMQALITRLIQQNYAYIGKNGDVFFHVRSFNDYGCLSHHDIEQLESGARVEISEDKRDPLDFVLWKLAKPNEPCWDSPWGKGRPGWHIECSAMASDLLGQHFDIHAGGRDLIFPHHENEIAQSQACMQKKWVNVWMHTGFLQMEKEKMSKSLGNFVTIRDALQQHDAEVLRFFFLASHYRSPLIYSEDGLYQSQQSLHRFYTAMRHLPASPPATHTDFETKFIAAMDDDFNTPIAMAVLFDLAHEIQRLRPYDPSQAAALAALLKQLGGVLGILQKDPDVYFQAGRDIDSEKIHHLIQAREQARRDKKWAEADAIRDELANMGVLIEDGAKGTSWKRV